MEEISGIHRELVSLKIFLKVPYKKEDLNTRIQDIRQRIATSAINKCIQNRLLEGLASLEDSSLSQSDIAFKIKMLAEEVLSFPHEDSPSSTEESLDVINHDEFYKKKDLNIGKLICMSMKQGRAELFSSLLIHEGFLKIETSVLAILLKESLDKMYLDLSKALISHPNFKHMTPYQVGACLAKALRCNDKGIVFCLINHRSFSKMSSGSAAMCLSVAIRVKDNQTISQILQLKKCEEFDSNDLQFICQAATAAENPEMLKYCKNHDNFKKSSLHF